MEIDGKKIAEAIYEKLKSFPAPEKFLAGVLVGSDAASRSFLAQKKKAAGELGLDLRVYEFPVEISGDKLRKEVGRISGQKSCGGVILQLPLPGHINAQYVLNAIPPEKDVDVLGERALGAFYAGRGKVLPPVVAVAEEILKIFPIDLKQSVVAVVGPGRLIGKPMATWLLGKTKELIVLYRGADLGELKKADLVILGAGVPGFIKAEMLKGGAGIIDFGYSSARIDADKDGAQMNADVKRKITGDLDESSLQAKSSKLSFYTPTPGGTGPILVAKIIENFYKLNS